ncbi:hypothetical protein LSH36_1474g00001 [Paralvinella palmiformis]|uniref:L-Fucosyltransferase n=1 Tax=Paralvinella palmiformis TaxID=53620 RepID=A0AAD9ISK0_9ANNE|nr:hypothetical protein LSH36_1474g00001 [Paralvinella palmiformis]
MKKKIVHIYEFRGLASEVSKLWVNNATTDRVEAFQANTFYMTAKPAGRLGNQMFTYAVLFAVTRTNHTGIPVMIVDKNLDLVQNTFRTSLSIKVENGNIINSTKILARPNADTTIRVIHNVSTANLTLNGYIESHKYFALVKDDLRKEITFPRQIQKSVNNS